MFTIERQGYSTLIPLVLDAVNDLKNNGFIVKFPVDANGAYLAPSTTAFTIILESSSTVNPLNTDQPWRIAFQVYDTLTTGAAALGTMTVPQMLTIYASTPIQMGDDGSISLPVKNKNGPIFYYDEPTGTMGKKWSYTTIGPEQLADARPSIADDGQGFYNRFLIGNSLAEKTVPMTYRMSITNRGLFFGIWQSDTNETGQSFNWLLIQRSVDKDTGKIRGTTADTLPSLPYSKCPVFCINSTGNEYYKFVVREKDILSPSSRKIVSADTEDNPAVLNPQKQVSFNEDGNYVITFLNNLTTPRYKYSDELDMVGSISADVVGPGQEIDITVYGEALPRTYRALQANGPANTGMRLMVLVANPNA